MTSYDLPCAIDPKRASVVDGWSKGCLELRENPAIVKKANSVRPI